MVPKLPGNARPRTRIPSRPAVFYHGTDVESALRFLNGAPLDAAEAAARHFDGPGGFFLAVRWHDAQYFALRRVQGAILRYEISQQALVELGSAGASSRRLTYSGRSPRFVSKELFIPVPAFDLFNRLRAQGDITIKPSRKRRS